ncbi:PREDICTED: uncharacterized protein LOC106111883 isoform X5 [Papilio polytes]|uniref:uncharacterized protein LOC106111883 isoform X5 n=1 Tax=Papilio polytes TaxID=76194 RepID=UPI000676357C|nr:PREDICTED: uncharacterized protein LOC106111883 isoform X5 [Papilio polytes]
MRSFGLAALFAFAILTGCLGARERSRQRSGPARSAPAAASIKREVDFDCPEEFGYYPHPTDCTLYYVCVFGGALLESCTGGLMYSHELQTCDWPRNVGCDATGAVIDRGEELERLSERERDPPPPPPPRRTPPPPPPRAQPNPVITSRGQPKYNRQEYEKQQQLYAEVDDLPPVEELESDRQQRVYRGQPSTIGQVQKDRDGYRSESISSGRTLNSNIIPASISQNSGKFGSFSFGTQVDDRRTATVTPAPQTYRADSDISDSSQDRDKDIETNKISTDDKIQKTLVRRKRDLDMTGTNMTKGKMSDKSDNDEVIEYVDYNIESKPIEYDSGDDQIMSDRDKRQVRYILKNYKPEKQFLNLQHFSQYNPNLQRPRYQNVQSENFNAGNRKPYSIESNYFSTANPFLSYPADVSQSQRPFKPSLPDPFNQKVRHNPVNTQVITKSPPISSLNNKENPFSSLSGGFYNNAPKVQYNDQNNGQLAQTRPSFNPSMVTDSFQLPSIAVTMKPILHSTLSPEYRRPLNQAQVGHNQQINNERLKGIRNNQNQGQETPQEEDYDDSYESNESDETSDEDEDFKHDFPDPPYDFTHPKNKYANIENPFAKPDFDFDTYLSKLQNDHYSALGVTSAKPINIQPSSYKTNKMPLEVTTLPYKNSIRHSTTLNYKGVSTPRPFTVTNIPSSTSSFIGNARDVVQFSQFTTKPLLIKQNEKLTLNENFYNKNIQPTQSPIGNILSKLKPPNFTDERQLPITYSFSRPNESTKSPYNVSTLQNNNLVSRIPQILITSTGSPLNFDQNERPRRPENLNVRPISSVTPFTVTIQPTKSYSPGIKQSTLKTVTTAKEQLYTLQQFWNNPGNEKFVVQSTYRPSSESLLHDFSPSQPSKMSTKMPLKPYSVYSSTPKPFVSTIKTPSKRRPIPKPSPEMNDYYYDDEDEQYYYEPIVKPKYMPSTEVRPQRPPMAQNYHEYEDNYDEPSSHLKQGRPMTKEPIPINQNDISAVTKLPYRESDKHSVGKTTPLPPRMHHSNVDRPVISTYEINHLVPRNKSMSLRKPIRNQNGPFTMSPPKYLNQTTLRPYTVRHRLAKPVNEYNNLEKQKNARDRHPNIVAQMLTTPHDSYNQETRHTKTKHDDKSNSLEPTESITPSSYSPSPRPKMLYNGSQSYSPDQFDPFYAVYDEDGELYKDTDYVQQYNTASLRPAVQQTYRGTPPPSRRPVETYTPRPVTSDDYDDALIQGQINTQNQYQTPVRHSTRPSSTRGRGSAHYSTLSGSEAPQQQTNRGTPPTRSRPTLKPSTAIVSETKFVDIYAYPARRPAPVYPQPTPDKTAAKCRKDVCLLPDCYCGGKDVPGDLPVESVPQIVLLTFDDSVNDLNKVLYSDLFEKGRVNPNGCPISATFYVSHEWTDYSQVQNLYASGHEMASHTVSHSFGEQFSQKKWNREVGGQREILAAYGGVKLEDIRGMRAPFLSVGGNKMFKMLYDSNFTYDSSLPVYENRPPSWPYTLDYKLFHDCMIPPCPTKSYPGVWEVPMVMWQDLNGGRCSMGDACANPPEAEGVYKMLLKNFDRHYTTNRAPFGLFYHAAWFTQPHHKEGFIMFLDYINKMKDVWIVTNWQALQWVRDPTPISRLNNFQPFQCNYPDRPKKCNNPKVCNLWHKSGVRYMRTCQPCPEIYPWTGKTGIRSSRIDNEIDE